MSIENQVRIALRDERQRLKSENIQWDVADVMAIITPYLKKESAEESSDWDVYHNKESK